MASELTLRLQRGDVVIEVRGDASAVQTAFANLQTNGVGALGSLFGVAVSVIGAGSPAASTGAAPGPSTVVSAPTAPLWNASASFRFVVDALMLATPQQPFAADVNGDGRPDNVFGHVIHALVSQGLNLQAAVDTEMKAGNIITLLTVATELATPAPDQRTTVTLFAGRPMSPTARVYVVDPQVPAVTVQGRIVAGRFTYDDPRIGGAPVSRNIDLPFGPGLLSSLTIQGVGLAFDVAPDGSTISRGQITGSVKQGDVLNQLVPALAAVMNNTIQTAAGSPLAQGILQLFDTGGCTDPGGMVAQAGDQVISICELLTNPLLSSLMAPDVQIWDAQGNYRPNPLGGKPDSLSFGIGFTATSASF